MRDYYEDLWSRLPAELAPPDVARRRAFLSSHVKSGARALDLGCGAGVFTAQLQHEGAQAVGVEVAQAALDRARSSYPELDFRLTPIDGPLPFEDSSFDLVWASEVIEHVADTARWLSEVRRVLSARGRLLLSTPAHGRLRLALGGAERYSDPLGDHLHLYTRGSLRKLLEEFGFDVAELRAEGGPPGLRRLLLAVAVKL